MKRLCTLLLLVWVVACEKKVEPNSQTTKPTSSTVPLSTSTTSATVVSTTPVSGTPTSTTPTTTPISATPVSTAPTVTTPTTPTTTTPVTTPTQPVTTPTTPSYTNGSSNSILTLGNLTGATNNPDNADDYLLIKNQYVVSYNKSRGQANWVAWHLQKSDIGSAERKDDFRPDDTIPTGWYQVKPTDYSSVDGFDRGHFCPSADRTDTQANNSATFLMTNICPQAPSINRGMWADFEASCRELVQQGNELYIYSGSYGTTGTGSNGARSLLASGKVVVPAHLWKVVVVLPQGDNDLSRVSDQTTVIAIDILNSESLGDKDWDTFGNVQ